MEGNVINKWRVVFWKIDTWYLYTSLLYEAWSFFIAWITFALKVVLDEVCLDRCYPSKKKIIFVFEVFIAQITVKITNYIYIIILITYRNYFEFLLIIGPLITCIWNHRFFNLTVLTRWLLKKSHIPGQNNLLCFWIENLVCTGEMILGVTNPNARSSSIG